MSRRSRQLTYYAPPQDAPEPDPEPRPDALWGWSLAGVDGLAARVVRDNRHWFTGADRRDQHEAAREAIAGHLYAAGSPPSGRDLLDAGRRALAGDAIEARRTHGSGTALRWGYTLADLDVLTRSALSRGWGLRIGQAPRHDLVRSAITEALFAADERPEPGQLVRAGWAAITAHLAGERHHWGVNRDGTVRPGYIRYWDEVVRASRSPEGAVVERLALAQIWPRLREEEREALTALAVYGEYRAAAEALGLKYNTFCMRLLRGRERFLRLWHEGEEPSRMWGRDRRGGHVQRSGNDTVMGVLRRRARNKGVSP